MPGCRSRERRLKIALARSSAELHQLSLPQSGVATVLNCTIHILTGCLLLYLLQSSHGLPQIERGMPCSAPVFWA